MHGYFARLAQRSDIAPAVTARTPAGFAHADGNALDQHTEVIVTPSTGAAATASGSISMASPPGDAKTVASSSSAPPDRSSGLDTEMALSPDEPAQGTSAHREALVVATPVAQPAGFEAQRLALNHSGPATTQRGDGDQVHPVSSVFAATSLHEEISATRHVTAVGVARPHDAPARQRAGAYADPPSVRDATATSSLTIPATVAESFTGPTPRARPTPHTDPHTDRPSAQAAAASTRAPLQVHIGRIELEVRQPSPAIAPPPPPDASPPRSVSFNPHRHYLRGI